MAIDMYQVNSEKHREAAHTAYAAHSEFAEIEASAAARGYRKATMGEINASANSEWYAQDLFCWRGGLWIPTVQAI